MKNVFLTVSVLLSSFAASAQSITTLLNPQFIQNLPEIRVVAVNIQQYPKILATQPTAFLKFEFASCATQPFQANVQEQDGVLYVAADLAPHAVDCMGMAVVRQYELQISCDFRNRVVILNPASLTVQQ